MTLSAPSYNVELEVCANSLRRVAVVVHKTNLICCIIACMGLDISSDIIAAKCTCKTGVGGRYKHAAVVVFAIDEEEAPVYTRAQGNCWQG